MKRIVALAFLVALLLSACGGDGTTKPGRTGLAELASRWTLTMWEYALDADPSQTADWVETKSLAGHLVIDSGGSFAVTPMLPSGLGEDAGTLTVEGDSLYWNGENDEEWVRFELQGDRLTLWWPEVEFVDMNEDGEPEDVRLTVTFRR